MAQLPELRLVAVCDVIEARARETAEPLGIPYYLDAVEMVKKEKPDIVSILTDSGSHPRIGSQLAPYVSVVVVSGTVTGRPLAVVQVAP